MELVIDVIKFVLSVPDDDKAIGDALLFPALTGPVSAVAGTENI